MAPSFSILRSRGMDLSWPLSTSESTVNWTKLWFDTFDVSHLNFRHDYVRVCIFDPNLDNKIHFSTHGRHDGDLHDRLCLARFCRCAAEAHHCAGNAGRNDWPEPDGRFELRIDGYEGL